MCWEDVKIMRNTRSIQTNQTVAAAASRVIAPADPMRVSLIIGAPKTGYITYSFSDDAVLDNGINHYANSSPLCLDLAKHGDIVRRKITGIHSAGTETVGVWETVLIADSPNQLK